MLRLNCCNEKLHRQTKWFLAMHSLLATHINNTHYAAWSRIIYLIRWNVIYFICWTVFTMEPLKMDSQTLHYHRRQEYKLGKFRKFCNATGSLEATVSFNLQAISKESNILKTRHSIAPLPQSRQCIWFVPQNQWPLLPKVLHLIAKKNKGNAKRGISPRLKIWPGDLDHWPWKSIGFQIL